MASLSYTSSRDPFRSVNPSSRLSRMSSESSLVSSNEIFHDNFSVNVVNQSRYKVSLKLSQREIELLRESWTQMLNDNPGDNNGGGNSDGTNKLNSSSFASSLFCHQLYDNLLDMDPNLTKLFPSIRHQAVSFAGIMNVAIANLENLSVLNDVLEHLGRTHARILGIDSPYFKLMGEALIKTFQNRFIASEMDFTNELEDYWIKLYCFLANSILQSGIDPIIRYAEDDISKQTMLEIENISEDENSLFDGTSVLSKTNSTISNSTNVDSSSNSHVSRTSSVISPFINTKNSTNSTTTTASSTVRNSSSSESIFSPTKKALRNFASSNSSSKANNLNNNNNNNNITQPTPAIQAPTPTPAALAAATSAAATSTNGAHKLTTKRKFSKLGRSSKNNDDGTCIII
ncbi:hypothetical protein PACTADRAFT_77689 [Pachysolen tannophilus NRRL Y-2460]|uniref:Globin domain-containing protein n=1 Tax=Pachysolen tannophilus NRRL Y-2460 TaxID=669874 RepID=A0A1E4TNM6_PACTA|nr:hypothetical protein PACTADRAFT_77689 [Pachysolen tannophilus NRRL Y-2460]